MLNQKSKKKDNHKIKFAKNEEKIYLENEINSKKLIKKINEYMMNILLL